MAYVYGNAVRKENDVPQPQPEEAPRQPKKVSRQVHRNRSRALRMNAPYVVFLTIVAVCALLLCTKYLQLQSEVANRSKKIIALQEEVDSLKEQNMMNYNIILNSVNLEDVRNRAMNELGMRYSRPEQVIKYKSPTSSELKQYENIPKNGVVAGQKKKEK